MFSRLNIRLFLSAIALCFLSLPAFGQSTYPSDRTFVLFQERIKPDTIGIEIFAIDPSTSTSERMLTSTIKVVPQHTTKIVSFAHLGEKRFILKTSLRSLISSEPTTQNVSNFIQNSGVKALSEWSGKRNTAVAIGGQYMDHVYTVDRYGNQTEILPPMWVADNRFLANGQMLEHILGIQRVNDTDLVVLTTHRLVYKSLTPNGVENFWQFKNDHLNQGGIVMPHGALEFSELRDFIATENGAWILSTLSDPKLRVNYVKLFYFDFAKARAGKIEDGIYRPASVNSQYIELYDIDGKDLIYSDFGNVYRLDRTTNKTHLGIGPFDVTKLQNDYGIVFSTITQSNKVLVNHPRSGFPGIFPKRDKKYNPSLANAAKNANAQPATRPQSVNEKKRMTEMKAAFKKQLRSQYAESKTAEALSRDVNSSTSLIYQFPKTTPDKMIEKFGLEINRDGLVAVAGKEQSIIVLDELFEYLAALENGCNILLKP